MREHPTPQPSHVRRRDGREPTPSSVFGVFAFCVGLFGGVLIAIATRWIVEGGGESDLALYRAVRDTVDESFVDPVDSADLLDDALRGLVEGLDPYSRYYSTDGIPQLDRETSGLYAGVGIVFRSPIEGGRVLFAQEGSPAEAAGVRPGDRVLAVDGRPIADLGADGMRRHFGGAFGETVAVRLRSRGGAAREIRIEPEPIADPTVRHAALIDPARGVGYLAIVSFSHRTVAEFDAAVAGLSSEGMRALVIDLRYNPGGVLQAAVRLADRFLDGGPIVTTHSRSGVETTEAIPGDSQLRDLPLVVLVDRHTASASEILAAALQDHRAAVVVGEPTYGKGAVQTLIRFGEDRAVLKLTTSFYATPAARVLDRGFNRRGDAGIAPDVLVETPQELRADLQRYQLRYDPPPAAIEEIRRWEREERTELLGPAPRDPAVEAALALFAGEHPGTSELAEETS